MQYCTQVSKPGWLVGWLVGWWLMAVRVRVRVWSGGLYKPPCLVRWLFESYSTVFIVFSGCADLPIDHCMSLTCSCLLWAHSSPAFFHFLLAAFLLMGIFWSINFQNSIGGATVSWKILKLFKGYIHIQGVMYWSHTLFFTLAQTSSLPINQTVLVQVRMARTVLLSNIKHLPITIYFVQVYL